MAFRADIWSLLLGLTVLLPAAAGCGARSGLGGSEPVSTCPSAVGCGHVAFANPVAHPLDVNLVDPVTIVDLNGDGKLDLAIGDGQDMVFFNQGGGVFSDGVPCPTSLAGTWGFSAGDLNQDGAVDLVVGGIGGEYDLYVSVLLNDGHGGFAPGVLYSVGYGPGPVAAALGDLDGDGLLDIATANGSWGDGGIRVLSNLGDGTFAPPVTHGAVTLPMTIAAVDLNGDGRLDLVVEDHPTASFGGVDFFMNAGGGSFDAPITHPEIGWSTAFGDLNGDGWPDVACAGDSQTTVEVRLNAGDGTFGAAASYPVAQFPWPLVIADLNGDCRPDIVSIGDDDDTISVLPSLGDGTFGPADTHPVPLATTPSLAAGDLDGDGKVDLVFAYYDTHPRMSVLLNQGCAP